jgi:hypothetical protein
VTQFRVRPAQAKVEAGSVVHSLTMGDRRRVGGWLPDLCHACKFTPLMTMQNTLAGMKPN